MPAAEKSQQAFYQSRFDVLDWKDQPLFWFPQPELVTTPVGWKKINLSKVPLVPTKLGKAESFAIGHDSPSTPEEGVRLIAGTAFHRLYSLGQFFKLGGRPDSVAAYFPSLKSGSKELAKLELIAATVWPDFEKGQEMGLKTLWEMVYEQTLKEVESNLPIWIRPGDGIEMDEIFRLLKEGKIFSRGINLAERLANFKGIGSQTEENAQKLYFELGIICFIHEYNLILVARLDELVYARRKGEEGLTCVFDFKSGLCPDSFSEADLLYQLLMTKIARSVATTKDFLSNDGFPPHSGYVLTSIGNLSAREKNTMLVFRYGEGNNYYHLPLTISQESVRFRCLQQLEGWLGEMDRLKINSI